MNRKVDIIVASFLLIIFCKSTKGQDCALSGSGNREIDAYIGWPFRLSCITGFVEEFYSYYEDYDISCVVRDTRTGEFVIDVSLSASDYYYEVGNELYWTPDISLNGTLVYEYTFMIDDLCWNSTLTINPIVFQESSCSQSVEYFYDQNFITRTPTVNSNFIIDCQIYDSDSRPRLYFQDDRTDYSVAWYQNCNEIDNLRLQGPDITFVPFTFEDPGNYTCAFTYNGMTRYFSTNLCAYPDSLVTRPVVRCTDSYKANIGKSIVVECNANLGITNFRITNFFIHWQQLDSIGERYGDDLLNCTAGESPSEGVFIGSNNNRTSCPTEIITGQEMDCYDFPITGDLVLNFSSTATIQFEISNINENDFGVYRISMLRRFTDFNPVEVEIIIEENIVPELQNYALIVGICVGGVLLFLLLVGLIWWRLFYIRLFIKRNFAAFKNDDKEFGAVISYHFSREEVDKFNQDITKQAVLSINKILQDLGYKTFDENRDDNALAYKAEGIIGLMCRSHRVVIVLTSNYIKDHWSMFTLRKALFQMIEAKLKIAFIMLPGIKEYIKQHKQEDETCKLLYKAAKINDEIVWSNKENFNEKLFRNQLEYFMPKLNTMKRENRDVVA